MKLAAESWYVSGTFWAIAGVVAVVLIGVATVWIGWLAVNPKRRLLYGMPVVTPLLSADHDVLRELKVYRGDQVLTDPYILEIELVSQGRLDIPSDAFDKGRPLCLDVGAPILEILKASTSPLGRTVPGTEIDGTLLRIGPDLIGRGQTISFSLLVDGPNPKLSRPQSPLINVLVCEQPEDPTPRITEAVPMVMAAVVGGSVVIASIAAILGLALLLAVSVVVALAALVMAVRDIRARR